MRVISALVAVAIAVAVGPVIAQDKPAQKTPAPPPVALSGCVVRSDTTPVQYALRDETGTKTHRLTGMNMKGYVGQHVELLGAPPDSKRLQIKGGLVPNANVAAQAGSMDPSRAATAAAGGSAPVGDVQLPEFRVRSVKPLEGGCEK